MLITGHQQSSQLQPGIAIHKHPVAGDWFASICPSDQAASHIGNDNSIILYCHYSQIKIESVVIVDASCKPAGDSEGSNRYQCHSDSQIIELHVFNIDIERGNWL